MFFALAALPYALKVSCDSYCRVFAVLFPS